MIVDFHTHIFPDHMAEKTIAALSGQCGVAPSMNGTAAGLQASMEKSGITYSVVQNIATNPKQTVNVNRFAVSQLEKEGLIPFGSVHPLYENWKEELDLLAANGVPGIKFHPDYQDFYVDDESVYPIYEYALSLGMTILFHAGLDAGLVCDIHCSPERAARMLDRFEGGTFVLAHMGGYLLWEEVRRHLCGREVYFDSSFCAPMYGPGRTVQLVRDHGADKILFATDSPWEDPTACVKQWQSLPLTEEERELIFYKNAEKLLKGRVR